jgi:uncharacterized protein
MMAHVATLVVTERLNAPNLLGTFYVQRESDRCHSEMEFEGFEWDENKRLSNIAKHGLDFLDVIELLEGPHLIGSGNEVEGERRFLATGKIDDGYATAIFTRRGQVIRLISLRRARRNEREKYKDVFGD